MDYRAGVDIELALLARVDHRGREITGSRARGLLALLAGDLRSGCSTERLVAGLWPGELPEHPVKALQVVVTRARARLGPGLIAGTPMGYRLTLGPEQVDAGAVLLSAAAGERCLRDDSPAEALSHAEAGLALCEGAAGWDSGGDDPLSVLRAGRLPAFRALTRVRALALSRLGRPEEAAGPLTELAHDRPRDEEILAALLLSLAATAGPSAALARYDDYRRALRDEWGSDPGPELRRLHQELLHTAGPVVREGLRHEPNALLGREADLAAVAALLRSSRVTSIIGAGGLGKTRLAYAVSRAATQPVVHFVELAGVSAESDVASEVAAALGARSDRVAPRPPDTAGPKAGRAGVVDGIIAALGRGPSLLVLDNCEHVLPAAAELVAALVARSGDLRVLTTSRAALGLSSESVHPLPELTLATSVELFGLRARAVRPHADLPPVAVRDLCVSLEGLPLAVELAAARIRVMSVAEIAHRLDDRFALLRGNARDTPHRHRTLHAVIDWSWHLLEPAGRAAMRALSVFPGGFTAAAALHLLGDAAVLEQLAEQSLLKVTDDGQGTRFRMLETVREFSVARREEAGETGAVLDCFLAWARDFATGLESTLDDDFVRALAAIRAEHDNLAHALRTGLDRQDGATVAATAAVLGVLWFADSNLGRLAALAEQIPLPLSRFRPGPELVEMTRTAAAVGALSAFLLRGPRPLRLLAVLRRLPPPAPESLIGAVQIALGACDTQALERLGDSDRPLVASIANYALSSARADAGDQAGALRASRRMLALLGENGQPWLRGMAHARIGQFCLQLEPGETAFRELSAARVIAEQIGARASATRARWALVPANLQRGALDEAERGLEELIKDDEDAIPDWPAFGTCARAEIQLGRGDTDGGLRLWREAAEQLHGDDGVWPHEVRATAVLAHARHGRLDLVPAAVAGLPATLTTLLGTAAIPEFPTCGSLLLALGLAELLDPSIPAAAPRAPHPLTTGPSDIDRPASSPGAGGRDVRRAAIGVRLIALAERFGWQRGFQPATTGDWVRDVARQADGPAYTGAVSAYAGLGQESLRTAALAVLQARERVIGRVRG